MRAKFRELFFKYAVCSLLLLAAAWTQTQPAYAHMNTFGYSDIALNGESMTYDLFLDLQEVSQWMDLRSGGVFILGEEKPAKPGEAAWTPDELMPLVRESLTVRSGDVTVEPAIGGLSVEQRQNGSYLRMRLDCELPPAAETVSIDYRFFFDLDRNHQNFVSVREGESLKDIVFNRDSHELSLQLNKDGNSDGMTTVELPNWLAAMWEYAVVGVEHIWGGFDHLLFIVALVLARQNKWSYIKVLTAFTVGHSLTIALAALEIVRLSPAFVEPVIALSIAYVAVENIWLKDVKWRPAVALSFGLIHGFGFAQILQGANGDRFVLKLFSFNLGVEIGQLAVLAILLPLLLWAGKYKGYKNINYGVSCLIGVIALYWFVTRIISG